MMRLSMLGVYSSVCKNVRTTCQSGYHIYIFYDNNNRIKLASPRHGPASSLHPDVEMRDKNAIRGICEYHFAPIYMFAICALFVCVCILTNTTCLGAADRWREMVRCAYTISYARMRAPYMQAGAHNGMLDDF